MLLNPYFCCLPLGFGSPLRQVVPSLSEQDAIAVMLEAHNTGIGLVIVCDIEPAEFYCETLKAKGLSSTIEPES